MRGLKSTIIQSIALILASMLTLVVSSYAWFVNGRNPYVTAFDMKVIGISKFEISFFRGETNAAGELQRYVEVLPEQLADEPFVDELMVPGLKTYCRIAIKNVSGTDVGLDVYFRGLTYSFTVFNYSGKTPEEREEEELEHVRNEIKPYLYLYTYFYEATEQKPEYDEEAGDSGANKKIRILDEPPAGIGIPKASNEFWILRRENIGAKLKDQTTYYLDYEFYYDKDAQWPDGMFVLQFGDLDSNSNSGITFVGEVI